MTTTLHGIKNCDTIKKAIKWLNANNVEYAFHDFKKQGLDPDVLDSWIHSVGWEILLNRRGTTWRRLSEETKSRLDESSAKKIMLDNLSIIKRPVLETNGAIHVGFNETNYQKIFSHV